MVDDHYSMAMQRLNRLIGGTYHFFKAEEEGLCKGISPENMAKYGTVPPF